MKDIKDAISRHEVEVMSRWGKSDEYKESSKRIKGYGSEEWKIIREEDDAIISTFASLTDSFVDDYKVVETVMRWQNHISRYYYECGDEILLSLGGMYVSDERFIKTLDRYKEGTASFMHKAIKAYMKGRK